MATNHSEARNQDALTMSGTDTGHEMANSSESACRADDIQQKINFYVSGLHKLLDEAGVSSLEELQKREVQNVDPNANRTSAVKGASSKATDIKRNERSQHKPVNKKALKTLTTLKNMKQTGGFK